MMAQVSKPLEQSWICDKKIVLLKEKIPAQLSPLKEVEGYFSHGYARRVPCNELEAVKNKPVRYLAHHPVFQPEKKRKLESR